MESAVGTKGPGSFCERARRSEGHTAKICEKARRLQGNSPSVGGKITLRGSPSFERSLSETDLRSEGGIFFVSDASVEQKKKGEKPNQKINARFFFNTRCRIHVVG